jgi:hypothetical protein
MNLRGGPDIKKQILSNIFFILGSSKIMKILPPKKRLTRSKKLRIKRKGTI